MRQTKQSPRQKHAEKEIRSFVLSRDPNKAIQEMMEQIDYFRGIYIEETQALRDADTDKFFALQDRKLDAADVFESGMKQLMARKEELKGADPRLKRELREMQADFSSLTRENLDELERMKRCTDRLGQTLRHAAKETAKRKRALSYGENGSMNGKERKSLSMGVSETA